MVGFAILLLGLGQLPAPLAGTAVDGRERPLAGAEIFLVEGQAPDGTATVLARAKSDGQGRYRLEAPGPDRKRLSLLRPVVLAFHPGSGLVAFVTSPLKGAAPAPDRLVFDSAEKRAVTLRDGRGRPIAGARLAPLAVLPVQPNYISPSIIPDELVDRMEVVTGAGGRADLTGLAPLTGLIALRITIPGFGSHALGLPGESSRSPSIELDLKPAGRIAGRVRRDDGQPVAGATVTVWSDLRPSFRPMPVLFEAGPIQTAADGSFRTPPGLLAGVKYRASVRAEGFEPASSPWTTPEGGTQAVAELPQVVLRPLRAIAGRVVDRLGRPIPGAEILIRGLETRVRGSDASAKAGADGRFQLKGLPPGAAILVVRKDGHRLHGQLVGERDVEVEVVLARFDESPTRTMATLASPIPPEEQRLLAQRVLDPFLARVLDKGEDSPKEWALRSLMAIDPAAALETVQRTNFHDNAQGQSFLRYLIAEELARDDLDEALAVARTIPQAHHNVLALADLSERLPADRRARKLELLDEAVASSGNEAEPGRRAAQLGTIAEQLYELGEVERAKALLAAGRTIAEALTPRDRVWRLLFATRLGHVDLPAALAFIKGDKDPEFRALVLGNIAARLAASDPAEAERLMDRIKDEPRGTFGTLMRTCQKMAPVDLPRARRIALARADVSDRYTALIFAAYGLPASRRDEARDLVRQALDEYENGRDRSITIAANLIPALMPLVESIDPGLVPELFWRAIVDSPRGNEARLALLLARYDRQVAALLFEPVGKSIATRGANASEVTPSVLMAMAAIDPLRAAEIVEAMPEPADLETKGANWLRLALSAFLGHEANGHWTDIWHIYSGLGTILDQRDILH